MREQYRELEQYFDSQYIVEHYPTLRLQRDRWSATRPLEGLTVLDATPLCRNSIYKYMNLIYAGAHLSIGLNPLSSTSPELMEILDRSGIELVRNDSAPREVDIIMDCAAQYLHFPARVGRVELTRSGTELYVERGERVFMADGGRIKMIETCIGTGESYFRAMEHLGYTHFERGGLSLFGCGKVGQGILKAAAERGIEVRVITDPSTMRDEDRRLCCEVIDYRDRERLTRSVLASYAVVSATGQRSAIERTIDPEVLIASPLILANMGAEDEWGESFPPQRILADKDSLNFTLAEPTELKYIDATLSLHNYGAEYMLRNPSEQGVILPPDTLEQQLLHESIECGVIGAKLYELLGSDL